MVGRLALASAEGASAQPEERLKKHVNLTSDPEALRNFMWSEER
jgi:hypothetical protein